MAAGTVAGVDEDAARRLVADRGFAAAAFGHLTEAMTALPFEALGPVKTLLKRYLSAGPWRPEDADALADAVGPGDGWWRRELDPEYSWPQAQARVNRAMGVGKRAEAGERQLDEGVRFLRRELEQLAQAHPDAAERLRIPASVEAIGARLEAATSGD